MNILLLYIIHAMVVYAHIYTFTALLSCIITQIYILTTNLCHSSMMFACMGKWALLHHFLAVCSRVLPNTVGLQIRM